MIRKTTLACLLFSLSTYASYPEFAPEEKVGNSSLVLNGIGIRKVTIFSLKVYFAGLYLEKKSNDSRAILDSKEIKKVKMKFVRDVSKKDVVKAWREGLEKNCHQDCDKVFELFNNLKDFLSDVNEGEVMTVIFYPGKMEYFFNGEKKGQVESEPFAKSVLSMWIGKNPPNKDLKEGMLGINK